MLSYFDALSTIEDNFSKFNDWVLYLNNELKLYLPNQKDRLSVFTVVFKKECEDFVFDCFSNMKKYTNKAATQHKGDSVYSNIRNIDSLFLKLYAHEAAFEIKKVNEIFKSHNVPWNEKEFKLLKESSNVAISILQSYFEEHLPEYFNSSKEYLSQENRDNLMKYTKTSFIKEIVTSILNNEPLIIKSSQVTFVQKSIKTKESSTHSFKINITKHDKFGKISDKLFKEEVESSLLDMMTKLIQYNYIAANTKPRHFYKIFSGGAVTEKIQWIKGKNHLKYFINELCKGKVEDVTGEKYKVASLCFDIGKEEIDFDPAIRKAGNSVQEKHQKELDICINQLFAIKSIKTTTRPST
jgi:hypothetical protein